MTTYNKEDPQSIRQMFNSIAQQYDRTNAIQSLFMQRGWNRALIREVIIPNKPSVFLDLCCGTGAIAFDYLKGIQHPIKVFMLDFSEKMLECAQAQAKLQHLQRHDIIYLQADAQAIPLLENSVDCAVVAYGVRNLPRPEKCLKDVYRVLRPRGTFGILELTKPTNPLLRFGHNLYLHTVIPLIGKLTTSNPEAYRYLCNSIHTFMAPDTLVEMMRQAGFADVKKKSLSGGIATIITGIKK